MSIKPHAIKPDEMKPERHIRVEILKQKNVFRRRLYNYKLSEKEINKEDEK